MLTGRRFVLVIDHDGVSVPFPHGRRLALWFGAAARRRFGLIDIFTPRENWLIPPKADSASGQEAPH